MHKPADELLKELGQAKKKIVLGGVYYHYKNSNQHYKVVDIVILEATDEIAVVYEAQYGSTLRFVRPLTSWCERITWHGRQVSRFTQI